MADVNALAGVILTLKALGIVGARGDDVVASFDFFEPPHAVITLILSSNAVTLISELQADEAKMLALN
uniref:Uncharacterized protein n=1 Tax=Oryza meridionalis TaxID=40149 RepID=A0A0E0F388_9ORYZ